MSNATPKQLQSIHAALYRRNLLHNKADIIEGITEGRTTTSKDLTAEEAEALLKWINVQPVEDERNAKMIRRIIAMGHELRMVKKVKKVNAGGNMVERNDYTDLNKWMTAHSYLKKELHQYTYMELPKLVTQFQEFYFYKLKQNK